MLSKASYEVVCVLFFLAFSSVPSSEATLQQRISGQEKRLSNASVDPTSLSETHRSNGVKMMMSLRCAIEDHKDNWIDFVSKTLETTAERTSSNAIRKNQQTRRKGLTLANSTCGNLILGGYASHPLLQSQVDTNALYLIGTFAQGIGSMSLNNVAFEVRHQFPDVRYFRITTYTIATGFMVDEMLDVDIVPDPGSVNPFLETDGHLSKMPINYTMWIAPGASDKTRIEAIVNATSEPHSSSTVRNLMFFGENVGPVAMMFRFYIPDAKHINLESYISFPEIRAYDLSTGQPARRCPAWSLSPTSFVAQNVRKGMNFPHLPAPPNNTIGFFRSQGAYWADGLKDSGYMFTLLRLSSIEDAVLLQMRIPRYSPIPMPTNPLKDQVRMTSICSSGPNLASPTGSCLSDAEMMDHAFDDFDEEGQPVKVATILLAHNVKRFANQAAVMNASTMDLYSFYRLTSMVIRHKVVNADFRNNSVLAVPVSLSITGGNGISDMNGTIPICPTVLCEASQYIGGWAPRAIYCTSLQVKTGNCRF